MNQIRPSSSFLSFPQLPFAFAEKYAAAEIRMRSFGTEEDDLAVDFSSADIAALVLRILEQCAVGGKSEIPKNFFRDLSIGKRLEYLLRLAAGTERTAFYFSFKCTVCAEDLEFELTLDEIAEIQSEADLSETIEVETAQGNLVFRKPLGKDQEIWQETIFEDEQTAVIEIARTLQIAPATPLKIEDEILQKIEQALDEADPLINFFGRVRCANCDSVSEFETDLCRFALNELHFSQQKLLHAVHRLASHYHWSEHEIFAVPHWRRLKYLQLIADEKTK